MDDSSMWAVLRKTFQDALTKDNKVNTLIVCYSSLFLYMYIYWFYYAFNLYWYSFRTL